MTHGLTIPFGKHKGELYTRLPISYLRWIMNQQPTNSLIATAKAIAAEELQRRGTDVDNGIEISAHALDRCSLRCLSIYLKKRGKDEGLHTWMARMAQRALASVPEEQPERVHFHGIIWIFSYGECYPTLKTVFLNDKTRRPSEKEEIIEDDETYL